MATRVLVDGEKGVSSSSADVVEEETSVINSKSNAVSLFEEARKVGEAVGEGVEEFSKRYDFLSAFSGGMCVTGYCVMRGQDPWSALIITATATVTALVINELMEEPM
ncbi:hypothetical protein HOP50_07g50050 [Chloropicon primus]|uniref:Uncharacterized protein n=2 Tax=Chloropicon primus TaxID=1764295 RepID=A0A5B8MR31_9CHLO|nr:hypothetical protein A3770_07p49820 [Chloropicon primus]UPR01683.1 hypothetical protein HOP50_07g50050 [Chloropicon primus]|eukprot:QDZ22464.1 hypothetical protein A3770_07p49820 [Chloropicon primus]